jgi:hypothetical protein
MHLIECNVTNRRWLHQGRFWEVRDFEGTTLDRESAPWLFHPTLNRLKSFIQIRWGHSAAGVGVVIDGDKTKKFSIPARHRLFQVTGAEVHASWHECHEVYESQSTQPDGKILPEDASFQKNRKVVVIYFENHLVKNYIHTRPEQTECA